MRRSVKTMSKSKYGSQKTTVDGITFDSVREAQRWRELKLLERAGKIRALQRQIKYELIPAQRDETTGKVIEREVTYSADFGYIDTETGKPHIEDVKGVKTKDYIIKRKLMLWVHGIRVEEV